MLEAEGVGLLMIGQLKIEVTTVVINMGIPRRIGLLRGRRLGAPVVDKVMCLVVVMVRYSLVTLNRVDEVIPQRN